MLRRSDLEPAVEAGILDRAQADRLAAFYAVPRGSEDEPRFRLGHVLYYLGGMIAIGAMSLFMTLGWGFGEGLGGVAIAIAYGALFLGLTHKALDRKLGIPAGIFATLALVMVPLAIFSLQSALGLWRDAVAYRDYHARIDARWLWMELGTLTAGTILVSIYRFPFLLMPVAVTLWYMSMDLTPFFVGNEGSFRLRCLVSVAFGLATTLLAFAVDVRSRAARDYAFWLYIFGVLTFWGGLSALDSGSELSRFLYAVLNVGMVLVGAVLVRRIFSVCGGLGLAGYLGYLTHRVFEDSLLFAFVLSLIGVGIVGLGVLWQRHEHALTKRLHAQLPPALRELLEARASA